MAFCVVEKNISARTCPNQRMNKVFIAKLWQSFSGPRNLCYYLEHKHTELSVRV